MKEQQEKYNLPVGWIWTTLEKICYKITDGSHNPPPKQDKGIPMLSARNVENYVINFDKDVRYINEEDYLREAFYTKKYKVEHAHDWTFVMFHNGVAQWYQNSIIVREGTDFDLTNGGFMWLGTRGRQLVCYERDFSVRYIKDIDVTAANYPSAGGYYIPVSNTDEIVFSRGGLIMRSAILVSVEDAWVGVKPIVWQVDIKKVHSLPADFSVRLTDYTISKVTWC